MEHGLEVDTQLASAKPCSSGDEGEACLVSCCSFWLYVHPPPRSERHLVVDSGSVDLTRDPQGTAPCFSQAPCRPAFSVTHL